MAQNGSKADTTKQTDSLWVVVDKETDEIVKTATYTRKGEKKARGGLLAIYATRKDAREARDSGRVRKEGTKIVEFCEYIED